jgi:hypothetical protein
MVAPSRFCPPLLAALSLVCCAVPAQAQIATTKPYASLFLVRSVDAVDSQGQSTSAPLSTPLMTASAAMPVAVPPATPPPSRGALRSVLPSMYAGMVTLQALDTHSTFRALDSGHVESNPLMRWSTQHPVALVSLKASATAATIYVAEKIRKKHPKRALAFITAVNAAYALVVVHNYRVPVK